MLDSRVVLIPNLLHELINFSSVEVFVTEQLSPFQCSGKESADFKGKEKSSFSGHWSWCRLTLATTISDMLLLQPHFAASQVFLLLGIKCPDAHKEAELIRKDVCILVVNSSCCHKEKQREGNVEKEI